MRHKQTEDHKPSYFSSTVIFKTILRTENIGKIYHQHKIGEMLSVTLSKCCNKISKKKNYPNQYKELILNPNIKFEIKI